MQKNGAGSHKLEVRVVSVEAPNATERLRRAVDLLLNAAVAAEGCEEAGAAGHVQSEETLPAPTNGQAPAKGDEART